MERMITDYERLQLVKALDDEIKLWEVRERLIEASEWLNEVEHEAA